MLFKVEKENREWTPEGCKNKIIVQCMAVKSKK